MSEIPDSNTQLVQRSDRVKSRLGDRTQMSVNGEPTSSDLQIVVVAHIRRSVRIGVCRHRRTESSCPSDGRGTAPYGHAVTESPGEKVVVRSALGNPSISQLSDGQLRLFAQVTGVGEARIVRSRSQLDTNSSCQDGPGTAPCAHG